MAIQVKSLNWFAKPTTWQQMRAWQERRAAMREQFEQTNAALIAGFQKAWTTEISGVGDLATQQAVSRLQAQVEARNEAAQKQIAATAASLSTVV